MIKNLFRSLLVSSFILVLSSKGFASSPDDPYETYNRHAFTMNETLDKNILKPVARVYNQVLPDPVKESIGNFFSNVGEISTIANDLLQGEWMQTASDGWRFAINSTIGLFGLFDVASHMSLPPHDNDFGLTLSKWGYKSSAYFVIPILGPSTIRDTIGMAPDYQVFSIYPQVRPVQDRYALLGLEGVEQRADLLNVEKVVDEASFDPYVFQRDAYLQHRNSLINAEESEKDDPYVAE